MIEETAILKGLGGDADTIARELHEFAASASALSDDHPRFIDAYPQKWVAVYHGRVAVVADSLEDLAETAKSEGIPSEQIIIRYIDRNQKTLFL